MSELTDMDIDWADDEEDEYCLACGNTGIIQCDCGGDICVCGATELPCPDCERGWN